MSIYRFALVHNKPFDLWPAPDEHESLPTPLGGPEHSPDFTLSGVLLNRNDVVTHVVPAIELMRRAVGAKLLRTCKMINREATPVYYGENEFRFTMEDGWIPLYDFLTRIGQQNRAYIRRLSVFVPVPEEEYLLKSQMAQKAPALSIVMDELGLDLPEDQHNLCAQEAAERCCKIWLEEKTLRHLFLVIPYGVNLYADTLRVNIFRAFNAFVAAQEELSLEISLVIHEKSEIGDNSNELQDAIIDLEESRGWQTLVKFDGDHRYHVAVFEEA